MCDLLTLAIPFVPYVCQSRVVAGLDVVALERRVQLEKNGGRVANEWNCAVLVSVGRVDLHARKAHLRILEQRLRGGREIG